MYRKEAVLLDKDIARFFGVNYYTDYGLKSGDNYLTYTYPTTDDAVVDTDILKKYCEVFPGDAGIDKTPIALIMRKLKEFDLMLCGGAVLSTFTGDKINDLDFYIGCGGINNLSKINEFFKFWFEADNFETSNAITYKRKSAHSAKKYTVQVIKKFSGTPEHIFSNFDFTITQCAYKLSDHSFVFSERFFADVAKRVLVYSGSSKYPICALYRTKKYGARGYSISGITLMHIALSIVRLEINNYADLKDQLMGVDTMYLAGLLKSPEYADNLPVDYAKFVEDVFMSIDGYSDEES